MLSKLAPVSVKLFGSASSGGLNSRTSWTLTLGRFAVATCGSPPVSLRSCGRRRSWPGSRKSTTEPKPTGTAIETEPLDDWQPIRGSELRCWGWRPWRASRKRALRSGNSFDCSLSWTATEKQEPAWVRFVLFSFSSIPAQCCVHTRQNVSTCSAVVISGSATFVWTGEKETGIPSRRCPNHEETGLILLFGSRRAGRGLVTL